VVHVAAGFGPANPIQRLLLNQSNSSSIASTNRIYDRRAGGAYLEVGEKQGISGGAGELFGTDQLAILASNGV
jgi:hypothetical protein